MSDNPANPNPAQPSEPNLKKVEVPEKSIKIEKNEKIEFKEKPEKIEHKEKPEKIEHKEKPEKFEHKEKPEKFEHKEKPEKLEHKEKPEKFEHKEKIEIKEKLERKEIAKLEVAEKPLGKEKDGKEIVEGGIGDPGGPIEQRLAALEQGMAAVQHFITTGQRPDLSRGALAAEADRKKP
jgi:hypothetical protein